MRNTWAVARKDLMIEWRARMLLVRVLPFALLVLVLDLCPSSGSQSAPALVLWQLAWAMMRSVLALGRGAVPLGEVERHRGARARRIARRSRAPCAFVVYTYPIGIRAASIRREHRI